MPSAESVPLERQKLYLDFCNAIIQAGYEPECVDLVNADLDDFEDYSNCLVSVSVPGAWLTCSLDLDSKTWHLSADAGYFQIGRKRSLGEVDWASQLEAVLKALLC